MIGTRRIQTDLHKILNQGARRVYMDPCNPCRSILHSSFVIRHSSFIIRHSSFVIRHSSFVIRHSSFIIRLLDPDSFRSVLGRFASGVTVLTTHDGTTDVGMTVSAFCSLSLQPPLVLACVDKTADMHAALPKGRRVVFNILSASQEALSRRFSEEEGTQRFDGIGFKRDEHGIAVLDDVLASIQGTIVEQHDAGDHSIFVAEVDGATSSDLRPLLYYRGGYAELER